MSKENLEIEYWKNMYSKSNAFGSGETKLAKMALEYIKNEKIDNILELGCGQGRDSTFFAEKKYNITAIDFSKKAIDFLKTLTEDRFSNLNMLVQDIRKKWEINQSFDFVYSNLALQFFDEIELSDIFEKVHQHLNSDGFFIFSTKKPGDKYHNTGEKISDVAFNTKGITRYFFEKTTIENLLEEKFSIDKFGEESHRNLDDSVSSWWYAIVRKY